MTHSITLLTLVHHNIYNAMTLLVSILTLWKSSKKVNTGFRTHFIDFYFFSLLLQSLQNTFGWRRMEVVGSISSLVFLFSLCFATAIEALQTLFHNDHLDTMHHPDWIMITVGGHYNLDNLSINNHTDVF